MLSFQWPYVVLRSALEKDPLPTVGAVFRSLSNRHSSEPQAINTPQTIISGPIGLLSMTTCPLHIVLYFSESYVCGGAEVTKSREHAYRPDGQSLARVIRMGNSYNNRIIISVDGIRFQLHCILSAMKISHFG